MENAKSKALVRLSEEFYSLNILLCHKKMTAYSSLLTKAQLICDELAKVGSNPMKFAFECMNCVEECRSIAAKGESDEK